MSNRSVKGSSPTERTLRQQTQDKAVEHEGRKRLDAISEQTVQRAEYLVEQLQSVVALLDPSSGYSQFLPSSEVARMGRRVKRTWTAWQHSRAEEGAERRQLFSALHSASMMVRDRYEDVNGAASWVLGYAPLAHRVDALSREQREQAESLCRTVLTASAKRQRFRAGSGKWPAISNLVFLVWGVRIAPTALRVEVSNSERESTLTA